MTETPMEFEAAAKGVPPLLPDHAPDPRHRVKGHDRTIPPRPIDPDVLSLPGIPAPEPRARKVPIKPHVRRNPRRQEAHPMTPIPGTVLDPAGTPVPITPLDQRAHARRTDPLTSHAAAASVDVTPSQAQVLDAFVSLGRGMTDEALVDLMEYVGNLSPSRIRTARKELVRAGLVEDTGENRPTKRGRKADVYALTEAGRAWGRT